ncbi:unnamed protein product [Protopolystoma xenopodis]|uniref:Uncharacterized protein n=1 Tax=Protopolystoma xenopodis TaxID=117903 RepID=A0A448WRB5_9PLAT|nr:unnamed protein product [Protopolystoma xenopodis]
MTCTSLDSKPKCIEKHSQSPSHLNQHYADEKASAQAMPSQSLHATVSQVYQTDATRFEFTIEPGALLCAFFNEWHWVCLFKASTSASGGRFDRRTPTLARPCRVIHMRMTEFRKSWSCGSDSLAPEGLATTSSEVTFFTCSGRQKGQNGTYTC